MNNKHEYESLQLRVPKEQNLFYKQDPELFDELISSIHALGGHIFRSLNARGKKQLKNAVPKLRHLKSWIEQMTSLKLSDPSFTMQTKVFWIIHCLEDFPRCQHCGKKIFHFNVKKGLDCQRCLPRHCSKSCAMRGGMLKQRKTNLEKYGNVCSLHGTQQEEMTKKTCMKNYGVDNPLKSPEIKDKIANTVASFSEEKKEEIKQKKVATCMKHFGEEHQFKSSAIQQKCKKTLDEHFGVESYFKTELHKKHMSNPEVNAKRIEKQFATKRKHGTLNTSKQEKECYELLCKAFGAENIFTQHKTAAYPFHCDFYIKSKDLHIELNLHWSHGGHPFDASNLKDVATVERWKSKGTKYYLNAVSTWTQRDPHKREVAKKNHLNYLEFWNIDEMKTWIASSRYINEESVQLTQTRA